MKWLFLLLLIGNIAYFSWNLFGEGGAVSVEKPLPEVVVSNAQLQLLSELTQDEMPPLRGIVDEKESEQGEIKADEEINNGSEVVTDTEPGVEQVASSDEEMITPEPQRLCYRVTNINKKKNQESLLRVIKEDNGRLLSEGETQIQLKKYWVMLPPYKSPSAAIAALKQLKETKVKDYYRIHSGDYTNAISLGLYSTIDAAKRRVREVRAQNITVGSPKLEEIELPAKRFWLTFSGTADVEAAAWNSRFEKLGIGQFELAEEICSPEPAE
jgi:hypothetical protein